MRKEYCKPAVRSEKLTVGVFGNYGGSESGGGCRWSPVGFLWPLFGICCGGGGG